MQIAYLVNCYPAVSHTFVRREIAGIERLGHRVARFSIRPPAADLPDELDRAERELTETVLAQSLPALLAALLATALTRPARVFAAWRRSGTMTPGRGFVTRLAYLVEACWLARRMARAGVEHLHAHFGTNPAAVARLVHLLSDIPYSFTVHGPDEFDDPRGLDLAGKIADARFAVAISDYGRSQLCRWAAVEHWAKIHVVRCGVDVAAMDAAAGAGAEAPVDFCTVARLAPQKGLPVLVDAVALLNTRGVRVRATVIGDGELRASLAAQIAARGLDDQIVLQGSRDGQAVARTLRASRAMVLPSFAEGLPVVIMEALALETPVVTTAIAGIPELVDAGCGWVVRPAAAEPLADAMAAAMQLPRDALATLGAEGRRRVLASHDADRNAALLLSHIQGQRG